MNLKICGALLFFSFLARGIAVAVEPVVEEGITYAKIGDTELKLDLARPS